jgi:hypothetical protein
MMRKAALLGLSLVSITLGTFGTLGCRVGSFAAPPKADLERGGVYVAYNLGCAEGCNDVARGDVILAVDGQPVETRADLMGANLTDQQTIALQILRPGETSPRIVEIQAKPRQDYPPLEDVPPFWTVSAEALDRAAEWARAPMFSHALPAFSFVHVDGGWINGRTMYGHKSIMVVWPDLPMYEHQYRNFRDQMSVFYRVLQKAQSDLAAKHVDIVFAVCGGSNDTTVRAELLEMSEPELPPLPVYRCPGVGGGWAPGAADGVQAFGLSPARQVGLENSAQSFFDYVRGFPVVVVVDEGGIVRWHSAGYYEGPQHTIVSAVMFALEQLDERTRLAGG